MHCSALGLGTHKYWLVFSRCLVHVNGTVCHSERANEEKRAIESAKCRLMPRQMTSVTFKSNATNANLLRNTRGHNATHITIFKSINTTHISIYDEHIS